MPQQIVIDSLEFAREGRELSGDLPLADMPRAGSYLLSSDGFLSYRLTGELGARGEPLLRLELTGSLPLQCQRCLERLDSPLDVDALYELRSDDGLTQDDLEDDSRDFLPADRAMDVLALIEDEVILALPVAPRHEDCSPPVMRRDDGVVTPFSVLATLGKKSQ
jgi:uncharacterized protein